MQALADLCDLGGSASLGGQVLLRWVSREVPVFAHLLGSRREVWLSSRPLGSDSGVQDEFNKAANTVEFPYLRGILCVPESSVSEHTCLWRKEEQ